MQFVRWLNMKVSVFPVLWATRIMCSARSACTAAGFSQSTSSPASRAATARGSCEKCGTAISTASQQPEAISSKPSPKTATPSGRFSRAQSRREARKSAAAQSETSGQRPSKIIRQCSLPMFPIPIIPSRIIVLSFFIKNP